MKLPAFQFYPADWRKDTAVQACSLAARGLWVELLCVAHECVPYGVLAINGTPMTVAQIARIVGESPSIVKRLLAELEHAGVFGRRDDGAIYSRRMLRDQRIREVRAQAGRLGGNPNLLKQNSKQKVKQVDKQTREQNLTPSSSASASAFPLPNGNGRIEDPPDPEKAMWDAGVALLGESGRPLLGKLAKAHGQAAVMAAIAETVSAHVPDPKPYLVACLKPKPGRRDSQGRVRVAL
jgi:hypothetical protein